MSQTQAKSNLLLNTWLEHAQSNIHHKTLTNGFNILFYHLPITKEVYLKIVYEVGSRDENQCQHGLAHMIEHMLFKGTDKMSETDLQRIAEQFGNTAWNAYTSMDQTAYYFVTDNKNWNVFLEIMADCMTNTSFKEHHFASEVKAVINELNMARSNPQRKSIITALSSVFPINHPYHHTTIGNREDLINASAHDLKNFYKKHYTPNKATLIVVGNLDKDDVFKTAEKLFGNISPSTDPTNSHFDPRAFLPSDFMQQHITMHTQTPRPHMIMYWKVPGQKSYESEVTQALTYIMNQRLKQLKDSLDLVYTAHALHYPLFDGGIFGVIVEPKTENYAQKMLSVSCEQQCRTFIEQQLADLMHTGPKQEELDQYKALYKNSFIESFEHYKSVAGILEDFILHKNKYEAFDRFSFVDNMTKSDIKTMCNTYLKNNVASSIYSLPLQDKEKKEWSHLQKEIESYENELLLKKKRDASIEEPSLLHKLPLPQMIDFSFEKPDIKTTLSNGIKVYIKQRSHVPTVTMTCCCQQPELLSLYHSINNKSLIPSMACSQLLEESAGTLDHPEPFSKKEHTDFFHQRGANCSFSTHGSSLSCMSSDFADVIQRFFHILTRPTYPEKVFSRVIYNTIQSIIQNQENEKHIATRELFQHLYKDYPWTHNDEQIIEEIKLYTQADLIFFHEHYIQPHNVALTLVGNIDPQKTIAILEKTFGAWQTPHSASTIPSINIPSISNPNAAKLSVFLPKEQVMITAGRLTTTKGTDDERALILIEKYLNRQLFMIREQTGLFYYCHARLVPSSFVTQGSTRITTQTNQSNVDKVIEEIKHVLEQLYIHGLPADYIEMAKRNQIFDLAKSFSTNDQLIDVYNYLISNNLPFDYYDKHLDHIACLTPEKINQAIKNYCNPDEWTFIQVGSVADDVTP